VTQLSVTAKKLITSILTRKNPIVCQAQLAWKCLLTPTFWQAILTRKVSQTDLVSVCDQGPLVAVYTQHYKSLCAAATTCATLVNIQTYRQHFDQLTWLSQPDDLKKPQLQETILGPQSQGLMVQVRQLAIEWFIYTTRQLNLPYLSSIMVQPNVVFIIPLFHITHML